MKRVALGLSGGVDSAVSAYLLKEQGYDVYCIYLNCYDSDDPACRARADRSDALKVSLHLNLPFQVLDFRKEYQTAVIGYFKKEYLAGRTPNPDVVCNRDIKFGLFLDWAIKNGFDAVATGHYAKLVQSSRHSKFFLRHSEPSPVILSKESATSEGSSSDSNRDDTNIPIASLDCHGSASPADPRNDGEVLLVCPRDLHKDQTYFLWQVPREKFQHVLFPLADYLKSEVRQIAHEIKLPVADKKDSTGICFVGEISVAEFLKRLGVKEKPGEVVIRNIRHSERSEESSVSDINSYTVIGYHKGVWFYTIGQRHGFDVTAWPGRHPERVCESKDPAAGDTNIPIGASRLDSSSKTPQNDGSTDMPPLYIIEKDIKTNRLVVGFGPECYRDSFEVSDCNWLGFEKETPSPGRSLLKRPAVAVLACLVRLRHCGDLIPCRIEKSDLKTRPVRQLAEEGRTLLGLKVSLSIPQRGLAPGQSAVFYTDKGLVTGGGVIQ